MELGYTFRVLDPPAYQRVVDAVARALTAPLAAIAVLNGIIPESWGKSIYQVAVFNPEGARRSLALTESPEEAWMLRDEAADRLRDLGVDQWSQEMTGRIPASFFE